MFQVISQLTYIRTRIHDTLNIKYFFHLIRIFKYIVLRSELQLQNIFLIAYNIFPLRLPQ